MFSYYLPYNFPLRLLVLHIIYTRKQKIGHQMKLKIKNPQQAVSP